MAPTRIGNSLTQHPPIHSYPYTYLGVSRASERWIMHIRFDLEGASWKGERNRQFEPIYWVDLSHCSVSAAQAPRNLASGPLAKDVAATVVQD